VRYLGCSNYPAWRLMEALWVSDLYGTTSFVSIQPHYNLVHRAEFERELADVVEEYDIGVIPYSPLQGGFLTGKYERDKPLPDSTRAERIQKNYFTDQNFQVLDAVQEIAAEHDRTAAQVSLAWLLSNPLVTAPIIGANSVEQLDELVQAAGLRLSDDEVARLDELSAWEED